MFGRVDEATKHELMARAHGQLATSVREGWGLVVSEAAAVGTPTMSYDVPGLRDSTTAADGVLCEPRPWGPLRGLPAPPRRSGQGTLTPPALLASRGCGELGHRGGAVVLDAVVNF